MWYFESRPSRKPKRGSENQIKKRRNDSKKQGWSQCNKVEGLALRADDQQQAFCGDGRCNQQETRFEI